jgi:DNA-binding SARP family transcriptional activator
VRQRIRYLILATRSDISLSSAVAVDVRDIAALSRRVLNSEVKLGQVALRDLYNWEELLPDWHDDWIATDREQLRHLQVHTLEAAAARLADEGKLADAIQFALRAIAADPFRDSAHSLLIRAYVAEGNKRAARRHYERYRDLLKQELGAEPPLEATLLN